MKFQRNAYRAGRTMVAALAAAIACAGPASAQIRMEPLAAPDIFSTGVDASATDAALWAGTSPRLMRAVLPRLAAANLSMAGQKLAWKLFSVGAVAPEGLESETSLAEARAELLLEMGAASGVDRILRSSPGLSSSSRLSRLAAEAALTTGSVEQACRIERGLLVERTGLFWLRLRSLCQLRDNQLPAAQLTYDLARQASPAPGGYNQLMGMMLGSSTNSPVASVAGPLELYLARTLKTEPDSGPHRISRRLQGKLPDWMSAPPEEPASLDALFTELARLAGNSSTPSASASMQIARLREQIVLQALSGQITSAVQRDQIARWNLAAPSSSPARLAALESAIVSGARGEVALQVLAIELAQPVTSQKAGAPRTGGLSSGDRRVIVSALWRAGLPDQARAYAAPAP